MILDLFINIKSRNVKCKILFFICVSEQVHAVSSKEKAEEKEQANKMRVALEVQMDQLRDAHQKQVAALRDEIMEKQSSINELKEYVFRLKLAMMLIE